VTDPETVTVDDTLTIKRSSANIASFTATAPKEQVNPPCTTPFGFALVATILGGSVVTTTLVAQTLLGANVNVGVKVVDIVLVEELIEVEVSVLVEVEVRVDVVVLVLVVVVVLITVLVLNLDGTGGIGGAVTVRNKSISI
jgi:hypothetical protein